MLPRLRQGLLPERQIKAAGLYKEQNGEGNDAEVVVWRPDPVLDVLDAFPGSTCYLGLDEFGPIPSPRRDGGQIHCLAEVSMKGLAALKQSHQRGEELLLCYFRHKNLSSICSSCLRWEQ